MTLADQYYTTILMLWCILLGVTWPSSSNNRGSTIPLTPAAQLPLPHISNGNDKPATEELSAETATDDGSGGPRRCLKGDSGRKAAAVAGTDADAGSGCFLESCGRTRSVNDISFWAAWVDSAPKSETFKHSDSFKHLYRMNNCLSQLPTNSNIIPAQYLWKTS